MWTELDIPWIKGVLEVIKIHDTGSFSEGRLCDVQ